LHRRGNNLTILFVRLSVCIKLSDTVSKRLGVSLKFFQVWYSLVILVFFTTKRRYAFLEKVLTVVLIWGHILEAS